MLRFSSLAFLSASEEFIGQIIHFAIKKKASKESK